MEHLYNIDIEDIIKQDQSSPNFNNELIIIRLSGQNEFEGNERIQIAALSLLIMLKGSLDININGTDYHLNAQAFLDVMDIHVVQNIRRSHDFSGYHIIATKGFVEEAMQGTRRFSASNFLSRYSRPVMELNKEEAQLLEQVLQNLTRNIYRNKHAFQRDIVKNELRCLFIEVANIILQRNQVPIDEPYRSKEAIVGQFISLLNTHCRSEHSVGFYARKLCIEDKYLSRILKAINGKPASHWIDQELIIQARILLKDHSVSIQQIADILHFSDQSAFGKFFKKHCQLSPLNYRQKWA